MWDRRGFPHHSLVYQSSIDTPADIVGAPFYFISMKFRGGIEAQVNEGWRTSVAIFQLRTLVARVVVHVHEQLRGVSAQELEVDFLARRIAVQENPRDQTRYIRRPHLGYEVAVQITPPTSDRRRSKLPGVGSARSVSCATLSGPIAKLLGLKRARLLGKVSSRSNQSSLSSSLNSFDRMPLLE